MPKIARAEWASDLFRLSVDCATSPPHEAKKRVRSFWHLLYVAPQSCLLRHVALVSAVRMQALLTADACDTAIMEMIGAEAKLTLSRRSGDAFLASVDLGEIAGDCHGATAALALVGAVALALSKRGSQPFVPLVQQVNGDSRVQGPPACEQAPRDRT